MASGPVDEEAGTLPLRRATVCIVAAVPEQALLVKKL
jgi:hypothetical protein